MYQVVNNRTYRLFTNGFCVSEYTDANIKAAMVEIKFFGGFNDANARDLLDRATTQRIGNITAVIFDRAVLTAPWGTIGQAIQRLMRKIDDDAAEKAAAAVSEFNRRYGEYYSGDVNYVQRQAAWRQAEEGLEKAWHSTSTEQFMASVPVMTAILGELIVTAFINAAKAANGVYGGLEYSHECPRLSEVWLACVMLLTKYNNMIEVNRADRAARQ